MSDASVYRCPSCGAAADPKAAACAYCGARLSPARCPWCFGWLDAATKDCPRCGAAAQAPPPGSKPLTCPTCRAGALAARALGGITLSGCARCGGVWAEAAAFKRLCEDRSAQVAYLGEAVSPQAPSVSDPSAAPVVYRPCAACGEMMNRVNFAGGSGVIVDVCKPHGLWFDADELRRIVAFIRSGGLDLLRERERRELVEERQRLDRERSALLDMPSLDISAPHPITAAGLLGKLFD